jgi:hypothetical protein
MKRDKKKAGTQQAEGTGPAAPRNRLEKLKRASKYVSPVLLSLSGPAAAASPDVPPPPMPDPIIPTLGEVGLGLLIGGLAAAGGMMVYRKKKTNQQGHGDVPDDPSKK